MAGEITKPDYFGEDFIRRVAISNPEAVPLLLRLRPKLIEESTEASSLQVPGLGIPHGDSSEPYDWSRDPNSGLTE